MSLGICRDGDLFKWMSVFFPNSFSYGVFANIGSGAVPGRLPNHGFREGSGTGSGAVGDNTWAYFLTIGTGATGHLKQFLSASMKKVYSVSALILIAPKTKMEHSMKPKQYGLHTGHIDSREFFTSLPH